MDDRDVRAQWVATPFVASWIGVARPGELVVAERGLRAAHWASWAVTSASSYIGSKDRPYVALTLPGKFYDAKGTAPKVPPHLEVPAWVEASSDPLFPDRLASAGNALLFNWWVPAEVLAVKRVLFTSVGSPAGALLDLLWAQRSALATATSELAATLEPRWQQVAPLLVDDADPMVSTVTDVFGSDEVAASFPAAAEFGLELVFEPKLAERSGRYAPRRVGVWQLRGCDPSSGARFTLGVVTPRLTTSSLFRDSLFDPGAESPASLLARCLVLNRVLDRHLGSQRVEVRPTPPSVTELAACLRPVGARDGHRQPQASTGAALAFLQSGADAASAYAAVAAWSTRTGSLLTVTEDGFVAAWRRSQRLLRRAEEPDRDDLNTILPLAWDARNRVVRVTFSPRR